MQTEVREFQLGSDRAHRMCLTILRLAVSALLAGLVVALASCASKPRTVDSPTQVPPVEVEPADGPSSSGLKATDVRDAVPRNEPRARYGNHSPYEVFGKKYTVMASSKGYVEKGTASWYGSKFHGRRTSSGEPYDMHLATAAHKYLPLPTYAEVTNLANGRKLIVKINDRGPFKHDRIIDLSYGAALRLGVIASGTAPVEVRAIDTSKLQIADAAPAVQPASGEESTVWLQAGAFGSREGAEALARRLDTARIQPVSINNSASLYRVWLGPFRNRSDIDSIISRAVELGFERPLRVRR